MSIRVLPISVVNKIAAGEVIERPASVVKELVENSIDAGSARIEIHLENGGADLIRVVDDGCGMSADDLALAFLGHATSKLSTEDDLFDVRTMGFRGEALASIGAVSDARIVSRTHDSDVAHEVEMKAGALGAVKDCGAPVGTQVEARNLFYNVPVRKKFLKSTATEMAQITEAVTRLALVQPQVHFVLNHNGRKVFNLPPAGDLAQAPRSRSRASSFRPPWTAATPPCSTRT
jgi:DNA mismatch repair protein MutL